MYAIFEDSGVQFKAGKGDTFRIDLRQGEKQPKKVEFDRVLLIGGDEDSSKNKIGEPFVKGASVTAEVIDDSDTEKLTIYKLKRRKGYKRKIGHRQNYLKVKVTDIKA